MKAFVAAAIAILAFPVANARADEWTVGPGIAYVSNINHVLDIYKDDVKAQGKTVDVRQGAARRRLIRCRLPDRTPACESAPASGRTSGSAAT